MYMKFQFRCEKLIKMYLLYLNNFFNPHKIKLQQTCRPKDDYCLHLVTKLICLLLCEHRWETRLKIPF